ncbi:helix-turn-helix domain-containing protein [Pseudonocardia kunmingensis]|uniref:Helix-turn-helix protein n=1 Tax=Pseudonocardia kunmingensis TaxID=630975 RepID=A0A543E2R4_9PSEU|nr:helix-turn-helix domain-containing protein [Pseudonocardia kunmingensis]TQM15895.1 helix-turn-helix protein [Pseudonocardia kunmingensis]
MTSDPWHDLDARLRAVEARLGIDPAGSELPRPNDPGVFWVLDGLRERLAGVDGGGVVFAGAVGTTAGRAEWQYGLGTEALLELDEGGADSAAARLAALGHPVRLRLLLAVLNGHTSPAALAELAGMGTTGQVYHHVRTLTGAGWLRSGGRGQVQVPADRIVPLLVAIAAAL